MTKGVVYDELKFPAHDCRQILIEHFGQESADGGNAKDPR